MSLDFAIVGVLAFCLYALTYLILRRRNNALNRLSAKFHKQSKHAEESFVVDWAFRGRSDTEDRLAHLFTLHPPLMMLVTFLSTLIIFQIVLAFLKIAASLGTLVVAVLLSFPLYHAADGFEAYLMTRAAERAGLSRLSEEDGYWLETGKLVLRNGMRYFSSLAFLVFTVVLFIIYIEPTVGRYLQISPLAEGLMSLALVGMSILTSTLMIPNISAGQISQESDQTFEFGAPFNQTEHGMFLDAHNAHILRFTRRLHPRQSHDRPESRRK